MADVDIIRKLDYSHRYTTARIHCLELYALCNILATINSILEIGAGYGISGVAIGLGALNVTADIIDDGQIRASIPKNLWLKYGIRKNYIKSNSLRWLNENPTRKYDFIYHDGSHGLSMLTEYRVCWARANKALAIHDVDQINFKQFVASLGNVSDWSYSFDSRGRALGVMLK